VPLAWLITVAFLPLAWAYAWKWWMLLGRPRPRAIALLLAGILVVAFLTASRALSGTKRPFLRPAYWITLACWVGANAAMALYLANPLFSRIEFVGLFVAASLWIVASAWMFYWPLSWRLRLSLLVPLLASAAVAMLLLKVDGMSGDGQLSYAWRFATRRDAGIITPRDAAHARIVLPPDEAPNSYPQFLGPERRAVVPDAQLSAAWSRSPPRLVWRIAVGAGWGAFAVVGNYAFTQEQRDADECVVCYAMDSGNELWCHADRQRFQSSAGAGPRATPTVVGNRVYSVGATGLLNCLQAETGRGRWSVNILADNDAENLAHGVSGSPLVVDNLVVVSPTGSNGISLAAYHKDSGKRVWRAGSDQASYSSPLLATLGGVPQILLYNSAGLAAHDLRDGRILWYFPWTNSDRNNCTQPVAAAGAADQVLVSTGYGKGSALVRVRRVSAGPWEPQVVWTSRAISSKFATAVVYKDHLYGLDDGVLVCVDLATGQRRWKQGRYHHGQLLLAGKLLIVQAESGAVFLIAPAPDGPRELGHFAALDGKTWNNPVLAGRLLLVRNDREAACFELPWNTAAGGRDEARVDR
jgi:outer membrane protein assembly factor BamB